MQKGNIKAFLKTLGKNNNKLFIHSCVRVPRARAYNAMIFSYLFARSIYFMKIVENYHRFSGRIGCLSGRYGSTGKLKRKKNESIVKINWNTILIISYSPYLFDHFS